MITAKVSVRNGTQTFIDAVLYESRQWGVIPVRVLAVSTSSCVYQFGFNPWVRLPPGLSFQLRTERVRMHYSRFSIVGRIALVAYILYAVARWLGQTAK